MNTAPRSFRIQAEPAYAEIVRDLLLAEGFSCTSEAFSPHCFSLTSEPFPLGSSLAALFGYIYIQDRSSMLPPLALAASTDPQALILDMCASPGSKTSFLAQLLPDCAIVANEPNPNRLATLRANLEHLGILSCVTLKSPGQDIPFPDNTFDAIQLDPPCSGWGTVAKNPKVTTIWKDTNSKSLIRLQRALLAKAARLVRPGGTILYSTCTTHDKENEEQVRFAETELPLRRVPLPPYPGFLYDEKEGGSGCLRVRQDERAQGFFLARLVKEGEAPKKNATEGLSPYPGFPKGAIEQEIGTAFFFPARTHPLRDYARIHGVPVGVFHAGTLNPKPSLRPFFGADGRKTLSLELKEIRDLIAGKTVTTDQDIKRATIAWRDLPLALVTVKNGRILCPKGSGR
ncbi:MAG: RsmB/NOP family class I SAM-dependent RNA methyltransferase [Desulfovibrionaceae bacterium]|nr:RsmB/NOP family class I SAM-dependent RNA methyltransferase [Desulfovibrionaceae bacterium]